MSWERKSYVMTELKKAFEDLQPWVFMRTEPRAFSFPSNAACRDHQKTDIYKDEVVQDVSQVESRGTQPLQEAVAASHAWNADLPGCSWFSAARQADSGILSLCRFAVGRLSQWTGVILVILRVPVLQCLGGRAHQTSQKLAEIVWVTGALMPPLQLFHLGLALGFSGSSAPFAFGKMLPIAEIGLGSKALGCLVELSLSPIHVIQNSM